MPNEPNLDLKRLLETKEGLKIILESIETSTCPEDKLPAKVTAEVKKYNREGRYWVVDWSPYAGEIYPYLVSEVVDNPGNELGKRATALLLDIYRVYSTDPSTCPPEDFLRIISALSTKKVGDPFFFEALESFLLSTSDQILLQYAQASVPALVDVINNSETQKISAAQKLVKLVSNLPGDFIPTITPSLLETVFKKTFGSGSWTWKWEMKPEEITQLLNSIANKADFSKHSGTILASILEVLKNREYFHNSPPYNCLLINWVISNAPKFSSKELFPALMEISRNEVIAENISTRSMSWEQYKNVSEITGNRLNSLLQQEEYRSMLASFLEKEGNDAINVILEVGNWDQKCWDDFKRGIEGSFSDASSYKTPDTIKRMTLACQRVKEYVPQLPIGEKLVKILQALEGIVRNVENTFYYHYNSDPRCKVTVGDTPKEAATAAMDAILKKTGVEQVLDPAILNRFRKTVEISNTDADPDADPGLERNDPPAL